MSAVVEISSKVGRAVPSAPCRVIPLDRIARHHSGNSKLIKGKLHDTPGENLYPAFSASGQDVWHTEFDREGDAIIISAVGARCGKCFLARGRWSAIANTHVVWPDPEQVDLKFLWYLLNDEQFWIRSGSAQPFVAVRKTFEKEILLPPLPEQRRIVAEIEKQFTRLEAGVAALRRVQAHLKRYRAAVLKAACEGRLVPTEAELQKSEDRGQKSKATFETGEALLARILTERRQNWQGRGQYKEPAAPDTANLPAIPDGWTWASLEQIARSSSYGTSAKCSPDNSGPPVLRIPNIAGGRIDLTDLKFAGTDEAIESGDELAPGDLLIIRTNGSKNLIGRSAVVRDKLNRTTSYASYLICFRLFGSRTLFDWVGTIWDVSFLRAWIEQRAATSAGQHNISMSVLSTMPIPLPPLAEQTRIVAEVERRLSVVEELEAVVSANLQRATRLRQAILQKAFSGRLVTADAFG